MRTTAQLSLQTSHIKPNQTTPSYTKPDQASPSHIKPRQAISLLEFSQAVAS
jgi:hypothetical protein